MWLFYRAKQVNVASVIKTAHTRDSLLHLGNWKVCLRGNCRPSEERAGIASSSTLHTFFDQVCRADSIPLISIFRSVARQWKISTYKPKERKKQHPKVTSSALGPPSPALGFFKLLSPFL